MSEPLLEETLEMMKHWFKTPLTSKYLHIPEELRHADSESSNLGLELIAEVRRLREQIARGLLLARVDLAGEVAEGEYLVRTPTVDGLGYEWDIDKRINRAWLYYEEKALRAFGPLPVLGKE
jgi:hypothetical protein